MCSKKYFTCLLGQAIGSKTKNALYQLIDNFTLFYFKFMEGKKYTDTNYWSKIEMSPLFNSFHMRIKVFFNHPHTLEENIEFYRNRMIETDNPDERVLSRFYGFPSNKCQPMLVEKITIDRIANKHGNNGIIYISGWRTNKDKETNEKTHWN